MKRAYTIAYTVLLFLVSCSGRRMDPYAISEGAPVWPAPPATARVQYVTSITRHQDLFETRGFLNRMVGFIAGEEDSRIVRPFALAIHPGGGLLVTDPGLGCVHFFDRERGKYIRIGGDQKSGLASPVGVAVASDGSILVSDSRETSIRRFDRDGKDLGTFGDAHAFRRPAGIAIEPESGEVYVADVLAHEVIVFSRDGILKRKIGSNGMELGEFNFPTHLAFDDSGNLLVSDSMNFRVQRLSPEGIPISEYGSLGNARGDFSNPKGIASPATGIYAAVEGLHDCIVFFDEKDRLLMTIGGTGSEPGEFWLPAGLASHGRLLFAADSYNSRVQVFRLLDTGVEEEGGPPR